MRNIISYSPTRHGYSIAVIDWDSKVEILSAPIDETVQDTPLKIAEHIIHHNKLKFEDFDFDLFNYECHCGKDLQSTYSCDGHFHFKCTHCGHYAYTAAVPECDEMF